MGTGRRRGLREDIRNCKFARPVPAVRSNRAALPIGPPWKFGSGRIFEMGWAQEGDGALGMIFEIKKES